MHGKLIVQKTINIYLHEDSQLEQIITLADLSKEPVTKCDQYEDFGNDEMVFSCPDSLSNSFNSCPIYIQLKKYPMSDVKNSPYYG